MKNEVELLKEKIERMESENRELKTKLADLEKALTGLRRKPAATFSVDETPSFSMSPPESYI